MITKMPTGTPIPGTRLWVAGSAGVVAVAPRPTQTGIDLFHNSTGVSAPSERRHR